MGLTTDLLVPTTQLTVPDQLPQPRGKQLNYEQILKLDTLEIGSLDQPH